MKSKRQRHPGKVYALVIAVTKDTSTDLLQIENSRIVNFEAVDVSFGVPRCQESIKTTCQDLPDVQGDLENKIDTWP